MMRYKYSKLKTDQDDTPCAKSNIKVDILRIVCNLRLCRGGMVQNSEQYELIHRTLCLYQERLATE
jgi:protein tyrosine phosphatase